MILKRLVAILLLSGTLSACATLRGNREEVAVVSTQFGEIRLVLFEDTPQHRENFLKLAREGAYDSTTFHRVIDGFMIQGGDPFTKDGDATNDGQGGPGYTLSAEITSNHRHVQGAVAAARKGDAVNPKRESNGAQFYIVEAEKGTPHLDNNYTVFGQVIDGIEVVEQIAEQPTNRANRPVEDIHMTVRVERLSRKKIAEAYGYQFPEE